MDTLLDSQTGPKERPARPEKEDTVCPYCGADPMVLWNKQTVDGSGLVILLVQCFDCRKLFSAAPIAQLDTKGGRIIRPS
jgi:DNA-directed RNA polymerase subunit M/transcription elongation factor TFIIS